MPQACVQGHAVLLLSRPLAARLLAESVPAPRVCALGFLVVRNAGSACRHALLAPLQRLALQIHSCESASVGAPPHKRHNGAA